MNYIKKELKKASPESLSQNEKREVLMSTNEEINNLAGDVAPNLENNILNNMKKNLLIKIAAVVVIFTSATATAFASNDSRPGDVLFGVDRALEEIQLALTVNDGREAELKLQFAEERLQEVRELISESKSSNSSNNSNSSSSSVSQTLEVEADVFTDVTLVKVELRNGVKEIFESVATTREGVINEVASKYSLTIEEVDAVLSFQIENRASRPNDRTISSNSNSNGDVSEGVAVALKFLSKTRSNFDDNNDSSSLEKLDAILNSLYGDIDSLGENTRIRMDDDKIEIRDGKNRLKIEFKKDGRIKIDSRNDDNDSSDDDSSSRGSGSSSDDDSDDDSSNDSDSSDDSSDDDSNDSSDDDSSDDSSNDVDSSSDDDGTSDQGSGNDDSSSDDSSSDSSSDDNSGSGSDSDSQSNDTSSDASVKIEAKIRDSLTEVEVEINGEKDKFTVNTTSRVEVVSHVATTYGLSVILVESLLEIN